MKLLRSILALLAITMSLNGQTDTEFWVALPDISFGTNGDFDSDDGTPIYLNITSLYATTVRISKPADPDFIPIEYLLDDLDAQTISLTSIMNLNDFETNSDDLGFIPKTGLLIESWPSEITAVIEYDNEDNRGVMPLKGSNALGQDFWVSTQNHWPSYFLNVIPFSGFTIVATENNTEVSVYQTMDFNSFHAFPTTLTLTLNKGESFAFTNVNKDSDHLMGIHVTSDKDIAIVAYDDAINFDNDCGVDMVVDQIVPTDNIGSEYFIKKGQLDILEFLYITATQDGTTVDIDGSSTALDAGDTLKHELTNDYTYITSDAGKPIYINQITGIRCEPSYALIPPIEECFGSNRVVFKRGDNALDELYFSLIARNGALAVDITNSFYIVNGATTTNIPSGYFAVSTDSKFIYLEDSPALKNFIGDFIAPGDVAEIYSTATRFQLGLLSGNKSYGTKYGFVSEYNVTPQTAGIGGFSNDSTLSVCNLNAVQLAANGGESYVWTGLSDPGIIDFLTNDSIADPVFDPDTSGVYVFNVEITSTCGTTDVEITVNSYSNPESTFSIAPYEVCSGDSILIENLSSTTYTAKQLWSFEPSIDTLDQSTVSNPFYYTLPENNSDTIQVHTVTLNSYSPGDYCVNSVSQEVSLLPGVSTEITYTDSIGCSPLIVEFEALASTGHESILYRWDFGNGAQGSDSIDTAYYSNSTSNTKIYDVELVVETPYGCMDTATTFMTVYPTVEATFSLDTNYSCSPLVATCDPEASINTDSLIWYVDYSHGNDSTYNSNVDTALIINHVNTTIADGPDTLLVSLIVFNEDLCSDTSTTRQLITYPDITAEFDVDLTEICDSDSITLTNNTFGYEVVYEWNFGNSSYANDSTAVDHVRTYYNRTTSDTVYNVRLKAISGNYCSDTKDTAITVHRYIEANFGFDYDDNCSPIFTEITNTSVFLPADNLIWDMGDNSALRYDQTNFNYTYKSATPDEDTTFYIQLTLESSDGCLDSLTRPLYVLPEIIADFDMDTNKTCSHNTIGFENLTTGGDLNYKWNFGNSLSGNVSSTIFDVYYENNSEYDTTYTISLIAQNTVGCTDTITYDLEVFANIQAFFDLPNSDSCPDFDIRLQNLSSESANVWNWEVDGISYLNTNIASPLPFSNDTLVVDTIPIELSVAGMDDAEHWTCSDTYSSEIYVYPRLDVDFVFDIYNGCQPLTSIPTNNTNITSGTSFQWYVNDFLKYSTEQPAEFEFFNNTDTDSTIKITLYGESEYGCTDSADYDVLVYSLVEANFTINKIGMCDYDSVTVDRSSSRGGINSATWNFDGYSISTMDEIFTHQFAPHANSSYENRTISLLVENSQACKDSTSLDLLLYPNVTAAFTPDTDETCYENLIEFTNSSINTDYAFWNYGDGQNSTTNDAIHTHFYRNSSNEDDSTFNVVLIANSEYDCYDTMDMDITIWPKPLADFSFPVSISCPPFEVQMINNSLGASTYFWTYNEETETEKEPIFEFDNDTTILEEQPIKLVITSVNSCKDSLTKTISVYPNLEADIITDDDTVGCSPLSATFKLQDYTNVDDLLWYIDNVAFSSLDSALYRFVNSDPADKDYTVKVVAYSVNNCVDSAFMPVQVYPSPIVNFSANPVPVDYDYTVDQTTVYFDNETEHQSIWDYTWDFNDLTTSQENESSASFAHIFGDRFWGEKDNNYRVPVTLVAANSTDAQCSDTSTIEIIINPPIPQVEIDEATITEGCVPLTVDFEAYTKYNYDDSFVWEFGYGIPSSTETSASYTYTEAGDYSVTLTIEGDAGTVSDYKIITVYAKPIVDFEFNDTIVSIEDTINFYNHSTNNIENFWYFDSEDIFSGNYNSTEEDSYWVYGEPGVYYPALIAKSTKDCYDTLIHEVSIKVFEVGVMQFPNTFFATPNLPSDEYATNQTDGGNLYVFYPKYESIDEFYIQIYDRWGRFIFESDDVTRGWNGFIDGKIAAQGTYVWRARGQFINGEVFDLGGDVTLLHAKSGIE